MKTMTRTIYLSASLILTAVSASVAQQSSGVAVNPTPPRVSVTAPAHTQVWVEGRESERKAFKDEDLKSKEVSKEVAVPKGGEIYIENASRNIVLKTWDQPKVKVTTTVYYDGESKLSDDEWLEKANLSLKTLGSSVKVKSGTIGGSYSYSSGGGMTFYGSTGRSSGVAVFNGGGQNIGTKSNLKRVVTVTIPAGSKFELESKYADVSLPANIGEANIEITNGNLEAENINKLILRSRYSNVSIGDVKTAEVEFNNGRFSAKSIADLDIDSKYSTIEMASVTKLVMRSTNDEYELEEADDVRGRKSYGNLRITKLNNAIDVEGSNADIRIRKTGTTLSLVKIDDKYADIRIPLRDVKNYSVDFAGGYSSVYGNFEKKAVTEKEEPKATAAEKAADVKTVTGRLTTTLALSGTWRDDNSPSKFTATVGDGKGLKIEMKCQNCTVDFK